MYKIVQRDIKNMFCWICSIPHCVKIFDDFFTLLNIHSCLSLRYFRLKIHIKKFCLKDKSFSRQLYFHLVRKREINTLCAFQTDDSLRYKLFICHFLSSNLKRTGIVYFTASFFPSCVPGFHFGIFLIMRKASSSQPLPMPLITCISERVPSFFTTKLK